MKVPTLVPIADIRVGRGRFRKALGNLDTLAQSIAEVGLLHPLVVTPDYLLIAGRRRLEACRKLNWAHIPIHVVPLTEIARGEFHENAVRLAFLPSELAAIMRALEPEERKAAKARQSEGQKAGGRGKKKLGGKLPPSSGKTRDQVARYVGVSGRTLEKMAEVVAAAKAEPKQFGSLVEEMDRSRRVHGVYKKLRVAQAAERLRADPPPPPTGPFRVLVIDPGWEYGRAGDPSHRTANPYPSHTLEEIEALPVATAAEPDSILWLWTTNGFLRQAFEVLDAWGFRYRTTLTWVKDKIGTGDWLRGQTEHCLMATKGKPVVTLKNEGTALYGLAREHSRKPEEFYRMVEGLCPCPEGGRVDWFSRELRQGWVSYGNEPTRFT